MLNFLDVRGIAETIFIYGFLLWFALVFCLLVYAIGRRLAKVMGPPPRTWMSSRGAY